MQRRTMLLGLRGLPAVLLATGPAQAEMPLVVIVGNDSPLRAVSSAELRKLFLRSSENIRGEPMIPFNHPPGAPLRIKFDQAILAMTTAEVGRYWIDRRLRGQPGPPRSADSPHLLKRVAAQLKGAITYVEADQLDGSVRALSVDGRPHTDPHYALR